MTVGSGAPVLSRSDRQTLSSLGASSFKDKASTFGPHAKSKAVGSLPGDVAWLKCPFQGVSSCCKAHKYYSKGFFGLFLVSSKQLPNLSNICLPGSLERAYISEKVLIFKDI